MPSISDFLSSAGVQTYQREKRQDEERQACAFLRRAFAEETASLTDADVLQVARTGLANAGRRGITNLRDRQRYLIPVMTWGSHFEADPQYRQALARCWWIDCAGRPTGSTHVSAVIAQIDRLHGEVASDMADMGRPVAVLGALYREHSGDVATRGLAMQTMERCWPARFASMGAACVESYLDATADAVRRYDLQSAGAVAYVCLAMQLGFRFADDPRFPWAGPALSPDGRTADQRQLAFGQAVLAYWRKTRVRGV